MMKTLLYLGLEAPPSQPDITWIHYPMIAICPKSFSDAKLTESFSRLHEASHLVVTSKQAAKLLVKACAHFQYPSDDLFKKPCLSIGAATAQVLRDLGFLQVATAQAEQQEGMYDLIRQHAKSKSMFFYAHSSRARAFLRLELEKSGISCIECDLYDTLYVKPEQDIDWNRVDGIFFSSPSTVASFFEHFQTLPQNCVFLSQGPITKQALDSAMLFSNTKKKRCIL